jgi:organic radical activating enzyme
MGFTTYLETNGSLPGNLTGLNVLPDYACVDIKDRSAGAALDWENLLDLELRTIGILRESGVSTFSKLVVTRNTDAMDVEMISKRLSSVKCPLAIQPVTPIGDVLPPSAQQLHSITQAAAKHLHPADLSLSVQIHKMIDVL